MWSILNGTLVNAATVIVGSVAGCMVGSKLPERYRLIVLQALGLVTLTLGMDAAVMKFAETTAKFSPPGAGGGTYGARLAMVMIGSLLIGALIGTALRLHERIEGIGSWIHGRFAGGDGRRFAEGFLSASVIFCVGPLTLLGCLRNGANGDPSYLYVKALLDGFCSMALAASFGWGVLASVATVLVVQGGLSILASRVAEPLHPLSVDLMTVVGGVVLLATGLMILEIKRIPVANLCPGIFLPPLVIWLVEALHPGLLLSAVC
ncbi:MAG: DUF554 domain-containing protein [Planctomycetes bacterium]|nr:DUF554 domain-containing protein [Planctomycetota bacterium]